MGAQDLLLVVGGVLLSAYGLWRLWRPWQRSRALAASEANLRRYESWRGGRTADDAGPSSADLMRAELRRQVLRWGGVAAIGAVVALVGLVGRP